MVNILWLIIIWLVVQWPSWKMMEFVNGKDGIPFKLWKTKIHVPNHQPDNKHRNMLAENDFYTIPHKRVALCGLRNMLAEYMALKMEKKRFFRQKLSFRPVDLEVLLNLGDSSLDQNHLAATASRCFFREKPWIWDHVNRVCLYFSHRSAKIFHMAPGTLVLDPRTNFGRKSRNFRWIPQSVDLYRSC